MEKKLKVARIKIDIQEDEIKEGKFDLTLDDFNEMHRQNEDLLGIRGRVISHAIMIEEVLDNIIAASFTQDKKVHVSFKEMMLKQEFFTFYSKWKVFRELSLDKHFFNFEDDKFRKNLLSELSSLIKIRNNFAHGDVLFVKKEAHLQYLKEGKIIKEKLDNDYFDKLNKQFTFVYNNLEIVLKAVLNKENQKSI